MLFINNKYTDVYFNLAIEEYLLKNSKEDIFMLGQNNSAVVIGKYQSAQAEIDIGFANEKQIDIARRYSGGGAVYHDCGNINLTFIESTTTINFDKYAEQIAKFLTLHGIDTTTDDRRGIYVGRSKISGSAQCVCKNRVMYHCTLLYSTDLDMLRLSLAGDQSSVDSRYGSAVKSVKSEVTNICSLMQNPPGIDAFKKNIFDFFFNNSSGNSICKLNARDTKAVKGLRDEKYSTFEWIYGR